MESIPLVSSQNPQLHTATTQADALNASPRPIPAQVQTSPEGDSIILNGTEYNLKLVNAQQRQILLTANTFISNTEVAEFKRNPFAQSLNTQSCINTLPGASCLTI